KGLNGMKRIIIFVCVLGVVFLSYGAECRSETLDADELIEVVQNSISGDKARDYTFRMWQYDKWSTLPMWKRTANEVRTIMLERGFDEAEIVDTPADGVTRYGTWTNPIGWDVKQATLEVIEPAGLPDEYRYLCNYLASPTSLNNYSCPTPPGGIEADLMFLERSNEAELKKLNADSKIILVSSGSRGMKKYLDENGVLGIVSDEIESLNKDFITANQWLNGWSDFYGGWQMNASDSRNNFGFSISKKKGDYLRNLIRQGQTVKVRAKIDSRYYTDDSLPYVSGLLKGSGSEGEEVLIVGHMYEWGANDNCSGCGSILESVGTLNDLIKAGVLPRPKRSIRVWMGFELYGSMAFTMHNLDRLRNKTIASVCCDTPAENYDASSTAFSVAMNINACPSFTDAVFPEIIGKYYSRYAPKKLWKSIPFESGLDNFFGDPMIGVPLNSVSMNNGSHLHHNSMDTIEKVDPRTLRELSILNAAYLYFLADAGFDEMQWFASLTHDRGIEVIREKSKEMKSRMFEAGDSESLGKILADGIKTIRYYTDLQKKAIDSIERIIPGDKLDGARESLAEYKNSLDKFGTLAAEQFQKETLNYAASKSIRIIAHEKDYGDWETKAARIIPKRTKVGTLTLEGIPHDEWREVRSSPRWWSDTNWATASYWWCDGKRNLNEIKELLEFEAGVPVSNFDLINFYEFLEKFELVEYVK
ncbi:hypothetical protein ACFL2X_03400, partial [Candidatus Latescibacterota bacterium]